MCRINLLKMCTSSVQKDVMIKKHNSYFNYSALHNLIKVRTKMPSKKEKLFCHHCSADFKTSSQLNNHILRGVCHHTIKKTKFNVMKFVISSLNFRKEYYLASSLFVKYKIALTEMFQSTDGIGPVDSYVSIITYL